ncbi:tyrosine-type recombinase/integrase [Micrococcus luteus]|uniref:tyrosine-type recombinase/integrase n=1 Tax=Micrococcus luteus TaxID=1270 RepID=UPI0036C27315
MTGRTRSKPRPRSRFGQVHALPSGRFRARYTTPDGARRTAPTTFTTRAEAEAYLTQVHAELLRGHAVALMPTTTTVGQYVTQWLDTATHLRPSTAQHYRRTAARWILAPVGSTHLAALALPDVTVTMVRTWHTELLAATAAAATAAPPAARTVHPARAWARSAGLDVPATGRLPARVLSAWQAAGAPTPGAAPAPRATVAAPGRTAAAHAYTLLRTIMGQAVRDGLIQHNPVQVKGATTAPRAERVPLTVAEVTALAEAVAPRYSAAVLVGAFSGLRPGELFALTRADLDQATGTLTVRRTMIELEGQMITYGPPKTAAGRRTVALPGTITAALVAHLDTYTGPGPEALIFTTAHGHPLSKTRRTRALAPGRDAINRPDVAWHHLRHTGATLAAISGATLAELQRRIGHSTPRAAMLYQHASTTRDADIAQRLDALITAPAPAPAPPTPTPARAPGTLPAPTGQGAATTASDPAQAWADLLAGWLHTCTAMGLDPAQAAHVAGRVRPVLAGPLAGLHPDTATAAELTAALAEVDDPKRRASARTMVQALLTDRAQATGTTPTELPEPPESVPSPSAPAAPAPAEAPDAPEAPTVLPAGYTARRFGHLSVISATA